MARMQTHYTAISCHRYCNLEDLMNSYMEELSQYIVDTALLHTSYNELIGVSSQFITTL